MHASRVMEPIKVEKGRREMGLIDGVNFIKAPSMHV
jgi:hypothetical protein